MYVPVSLIGYVTYGDSLQDSITPSIQVSQQITHQITQIFHLKSVLIQQIVNILITLHVILALTIIFNPLNQEFEELLNVPHGCSKCA